MTMFSKLPEGWHSVALAGITGDQGLFCDGDWIESKDQDPQGEVRLIQLQDIGIGLFLNKSNRFLTHKRAQELRCTYLEQGDILIARMPNPLGRACCFPRSNQLCVTAVDVSIVRLGHNQIDTSWLIHFLNSDFCRSQIESLASGTTRNRISRSNLGTIELVIPPLAEQRRIIAKLDALLARTRRAREELATIPFLIELFRTHVLLSGMSSTFLGAIENNRWPSVTIGSIAEIGTGSTPERSNSEYFTNDKNRGTLWVTSASTGHSIIRDADECVTSLAMSKYRLKKYPIGTLLIAMYGEGKTRGQVSQLGIEATINQACAAILVNEKVAMSAFVKLALQANYLKLRQLAEGGTQPNLNLGKIREFTIPLPSLLEQKEIVRRIESLFSRADALSAEVKAARERLDVLEQAVLAKAFRGELVPQDPNDEPASVLLERIRRERAEGESEGSSKRGRGRPRKAADVRG